MDFLLGIAPEINHRLKSLYGLTIDGRAKFRVVWSDSILEKRKGCFGGSDKPETREVKKYSYISNRWILEYYAPEARSNPEIDSDGYEPLYVYQDSKGNALPLAWKPTEYAVHLYLNREVEKKTDEMLQREAIEAEEKQIKKDEEALDISTPDQLKFRYGETVILPGKEN